MKTKPMRPIYHYFARLINVGLGLLLLLSVMPLAAQEDTPALRQPFGITGAYWRPDKADELNLAWETMVFDWAKIQPNGPGDFQIDDVFDEAWLTSAQRTNREVVGVIVNTPAWASVSGEPYAVPDGLYTPDDNPENLWAVFLNQFIPYMAERGIHSWFIWEAPDDFAAESEIPPHFAGPVEDYYRLLKISYQTIKAQDPTAQVFMGGLVGWADMAFNREVYLQQIVDIALNDPQAERYNYFFDGVLLDVGLTDNPVASAILTSDSAGDFVTQSRDILDAAGLSDKPIWVQLRASPMSDRFGGPLYKPVLITLEQQADFIVYGSVLALAAGAERVSIFKLFDSKFTVGETIPYGLIRHDNSERPAFASYRFISNELAPFQWASAGRSQNGRLVVVAQPDKTVYIMWAFGMKSVDFWIPSEFEDTILHYNRNGDPLPTPRQGIGLDELPVYVISAPAMIPNPVLGPDNQLGVSGTPRILVMEGTPRPVWAAIDGTAVQMFVPPES